MTEHEFLAWLAAVRPEERDRAIDARFGLEADAPSSAPPGDDLIGYHPSGVAPIVRALLEVPVAPDDVFVDLGAGLGKVVLLAALLTGAAARGIELQPALVVRAREAASRLGLAVRFDHGDVREADLGDGTVFFLYLPFTGGALAVVLDRLRVIAAKRQIVVCALGVDLDRTSWLARRSLADFWLALYDSTVSGAAPRRARATSLASPLATLIAEGRSRPEARVEAR
jgi:SAM-dependent methyltransferase